MNNPLTERQEKELRRIQTLLVDSIKDYMRRNRLRNHQFAKQTGTSATVLFDVMCKGNFTMKTLVRLTDTIGVRVVFEPKEEKTK